MFKTQHAMASASGIMGMAWCSGPRSSLVDVGAGADAVGGLGSASVGGSLMCTARSDLVQLDVDAVRPTYTCSFGAGR